MPVRCLPACGSLLLLSLLVAPARGQLLVDTLFVWQSYVRTSQCHLQIYASDENEDRNRIVVLREVAENKGLSTVADAAYLVELVGRSFEVPPEQALWVFYWGAFSYPGAEPNRRKQLFLRATFRRTRSRRLSSPAWKVLTREDVEVYTGRHFRE